MLYTLKVDIEGSQQEIPIFAIVGGELGRVTFNSILSSETVADSLFNEGYKLSVILGEESEVAGEEPLVFPVVKSGDKVSASNALYNIYQQSQFNVDFEKFRAILLKSNIDIEVEDLKLMFKGFEEYTTYKSRKANFIIKIPNSFTENVNALNAIKIYNSKRDSALTFLNSSINKTEVQETEFDRFFIKLPKYAILKEIENASELVTPITEMTNPYPHDVYRTPHGVYSYDMTPAEREQFLTQCMNGTGGHRSSLPKMNVKTIPPIPKKYIIGNSSNNSLGIREEELEFIESGRSYIKYDLEQGLGIPKEEVDEAYAKGVISPVLNNFFMEIVTQLLQLNWMHNNKIPTLDLSVFDEDDSDSDSDSDSESEKMGDKDVAEYFSFEYNHPLLHKATGLPIVKGFITLATKAVGNDAILEAIVKLGRWGEIKPSVLSITGYNKYLDLNTLMLKNTNGDISCQEEVLFKDHRFELKGIILNSNPLNDSNYVKSNRLKGTYENPMGLVVDLHLEEGYKQTVFMSILDVVTHYKNNPDDKFIYGVQYSGGKFSLTIDFDMDQFTVQLFDVIGRVLRDEDSIYIIETSDDCKKVEIESKISKGISPLESVHYVFSNRNIMTDVYPSVVVNSLPKAEQIALNVRIPMQNILRLNTFAQIFPVVDRVEDLLSDSLNVSLDMVLNSYNSAMNELKYISEFEYLSEISGNKANLMSDELTKLNAFSEVDKEETIAEMLQKAILKPVPENASISGLVDPEGKLFCGIYIDRDDEGKLFYLFTELSRVPAGANAFTSNAVVPIISTSLYELATGGKSKVFFESLEVFRNLNVAIMPKKK